MSEFECLNEALLLQWAEIALFGKSYGIRQASQRLGVIAEPLLPADILIVCFLGVSMVDRVCRC